MLLGVLAAVAAAFPANAGLDYQLGGDYPPPPGVTVVARDVTGGTPAGGYDVCYVNGYQTQPGERRDWPDRLVLDREDPDWPGEYLLDLRSAPRRAAIARRIGRLTNTCAEKGFDAVEFDNLDAWMRFDDLPHGRRETLDYARRLARRAHARGLAVGQKNTVELTRRQVRRVGFDFVVAEECGRYGECERYARLHEDRILAIEYRRKDFARACAAVGDRVSVILRDRLLRTPATDDYVYDAC